MDTLQSLAMAQQEVDSMKFAVKILFLSSGSIKYLVESVIYFNEDEVMTSLTVT